MNQRGLGKTDKDAPATFPMFSGKRFNNLLAIAMKRRLHINKPFVFIAAVLLAVSLVFFAIASGIYGQHLEWKDLPVKNMTVDLSRPGEYQSEFVHTYRFAYAYGCNLELILPEASIEAATDPQSMVKGLRGKISIQDDNGREMLRDANDGRFPDVS